MWRGTVRNKEGPAPQGPPWRRAWSHQERCTQDRRPRPMVIAKVVRNQMVLSRAE